VEEAAQPKPDTAAKGDPLDAGFEKYLAEMEAAEGTANAPNPTLTGFKSPRGFKNVPVRDTDAPTEAEAASTDKPGQAVSVFAGFCGSASRRATAETFEGVIPADTPNPSLTGFKSVRGFKDLEVRAVALPTTTASQPGQAISIFAGFCGSASRRATAETFEGVIPADAPNPSLTGFKSVRGFKNIQVREADAPTDAVAVSSNEPAGHFFAACCGKRAAGGLSGGAIGRTSAGWEAKRHEDAEREQAEKVAATAEMRERAIKVFKEMDLNNNGSLSRTEIRKYLNSAKNAEVKELLLGKDQYHWKYFFEALDKDKSVDVDAEEFANFFIMCSKFGSKTTTNLGLSEEEIDQRQRRERAIEVFKAMDLNKNGRLSRTEIRKYLKSAKNTKVKELLLGEEEYHWKPFFAALDKDKSVDVDAEEFADFYINCERTSEAGQAIDKALSSRPID